MRNLIPVTKKDIAPILNASFPDYRGRKFAVDASGSVTFMDICWGGGSKNTYHAVKLDTLESGRLASVSPFSDAFRVVEGASLDIPEDVVIVEHCCFCGKDLGIRIYVNPKNLPAMLPASLVS